MDTTAPNRNSDIEIGREGRPYAQKVQGSVSCVDLGQNIMDGVETDFQHLMAVGKKVRGPCRWFENYAIS